MGSLLTALRLVFLSFILIGCSFSGDHSGLRQFVADVKKRPAGSIEPLPVFKPYESFIYSAAAMRSPFERPIEVKRREVTRSDPSIKPNLNRKKEYLEGFDFASLKMVGTLKKGSTLWALVQDGLGGIHRVTSGNFIGKNHGRIVAANETKIDVIEIVSDGLDGWVERPRILAISEKE